MFEKTKYRLIGALLVVSSILLASWAGLGSMAVAPLSLRLPIAPGEQGAGTFLVRNTGTDPIVVHISLHDWWRTPEGKFQILPAGSLERSCAPWLVYSATTLELGPGEEAQVSVEVTVPEDVEGDHWALLLVAEEPQPVEEQQAEEGLTSTTRVVVTYAVKILQQDPENGAPAAEIRGIELVSQDPLTLQVHYANIGNCHITGQGMVELRDIFGETVRSYTVTPFPLLPGEERVVTIEDTTGEPLPEGLYYAIALFDFGGEYLVQGGAPIQITSTASTPQ
ncbi:hypothetical protein J7J35_05530 [Candidatus Bipolaricaulota bacterium]|nr:hypothetical protein [Candidatus Bipolaricaulota bacterium]